MGEAKRRQKADPNFGKTASSGDSSDNIFAIISKLPEAEQLWAIERIIEVAEIMRERDRQKRREMRKRAKELAKAARTPPDKPNEPNA